MDAAVAALPSLPVTPRTTNTNRAVSITSAVPAWLDRIGLAEPTMVSTHTVFAPSLASCA